MWYNEILTGDGQSVPATPCQPSSTSAADHRRLLFSLLNDPVENLRSIKYALSALHNVLDAEDAVQDAALKAINKIDGFQGGLHNLKAWRWVILRHTITDQLRLRSIKKRAGDVPVTSVSVTDDDSNFAVSVDPDGNPESVTISRDSWHKVIRGLAKMAKENPVHHRAILLWANGCSYHEIARFMGRSHAATKSTLHRARASLRRSQEEVTGV